MPTERLSLPFLSVLTQTDNLDERNQALYSVRSFKKRPAKIVFETLTKSKT